MSTMGWESREERVSRWMEIPPLKKMEWLQQAHKFVRKVSSKRMLAIRKKLRENRGI